MACTLASSALRPALKASAPTRAPRSQRLVVRASAGKQSVQDVVIRGTALAGLSAALLSSGSAQAAMEVANIAAGDNRGGLFALLALPAAGWVAFNILGPLQNQLYSMGASKRSVAAGLGLGAASLLAAQSAEAAQQVADIAAASDNRFGTISLLLVPVAGWVLFNILGPLQNQLDAMDTKKRSLAVGLGLGAASLLAAQNAEAAQQVAELAAGDNRGGLFAFLALPAAGWVLFNILGPLQNQLDAMSPKKRSVAAGLGLGAASLLAAQNAEAAQQVADLAASDNRFGTIAFLLLPVAGWVLFNILGPLQNQLDSMGDTKKGKK